MSKNDLIADMLTVIRNGLIVKKDKVDVPASKMCVSILEILKKEQYIEDFKLIDDKKQGVLRIYLKYVSGKPVITNLKRVSRLGLRVYVKAGRIPRVLRGRGISVISTSKGILTDDQARLDKIGGEVICNVW
ncbi:MAG: 30S ribosomal protein S8 [Candidatus Omnitrophica bacterium]|jgi:small subunit ribosomal protein S8|nr:30S ribosomal protein S8 [Candidatus Omnitrophota bacterium]MDD5654094.1 30S ribosomal protein S8 [Candidatus Omnitrophota bacterium]